MTDRRELILVRLLAVCETVGIGKVGRGLLQLSDAALPALALHDGDEQADESDPRPRPNAQPRRVTMMPAIAIRAVAASGAIGTILNGYRSALAKAAIEDAALAALTRLGAGSVRYEGCGLTLDEGRSAVGTMTVNLAITYLLDPREL